MNDFPAYEMICSWSMHGKLKSPCCMENNKAFTLTNSGKTSFFIATSDSSNRLQVQNE